MQSFITMSQLTSSEGFGSQMGNFACLYALAKRSGHRIIFMDHWVGGKGLLLPEAFDGLPLQILSHASLPPSTAVHIVKIDTKVVVDTRLLDLDPGQNYDFHAFFSSYRYWAPVKAEVLDLFGFKPEILAQARAVVGPAAAGGKQVVALHVRRTDYIDNARHANLSLGYYADACAHFKGSDYVFLVFSDDIEWCRQAFSRRANFIYAPASSQFVDMCAMSLCHHNIVANSSFSYWSALLNRNPAKKVICPGKYLLDDRELPYLNYAWFPDDWIPLDDY